MGICDSSHVRIAPAPKFVPWDASDDLRGLWVRLKMNGVEFAIVAKRPSGVYVGLNWIPFDALYSDYEQLDHSCCGKAVQS